MRSWAIRRWREDRAGARVIFLDAHAHLYPGYDRDRFFDALFANGGRLLPGATVAAAVMRRAGQPPLATLVEGGRRWRPLGRPDDATILMGDGTKNLWLFAARQVVAAEGIEAVGLLGDADVPDGLPLAQGLEALAAAGLVPVLAWGLGKWLGRRGGVVRELLAQRAPGTLLLGDCALRPTFWGRPRPMAAAQARGFRVVYGSDPLPRAADVAVAGCYATAVAGHLAPGSPAASLRRLLVDPAVGLTAVGRRQGLLGTLRRLR